MEPLGLPQSLHHAETPYLGGYHVLSPLHQVISIPFTPYISSAQGVAWPGLALHSSSE